MAFFDELGKKLTDGGQKAAEQARAFAEVNKLNSQVSDQEKKMRQVYAQIGRDYYEAHTNDPEDCVKASVEAINLAKQTIEKLKAQITAIKGGSTCPKCGAAISKGTVFCSQCGEKIPAAPEPLKRTRPQRRHLPIIKTVKKRRLRLRLSRSIPFRHGPAIRSSCPCA